MTITIVVIGGVVALTGIVLGNVAANQIWDEMSESARAEQGMFSASNELDPGSIQRNRGVAFRRYRAEQPHGSKLKSVRIGQLLSIVGMLFLLVGFFV